MAKDVSLAKAKVSVIAETEKHDKSIDKAKIKVKSLGTETEKMSIKAKAAWALVAAGAAGAVYELNEAINTASDLEEATSKFNTVFSSQISLANDWATALNKSYGQSTREAKENLGAIQDLLVPMGLAEKQAGKLSFEVVKLATDLGSFNNKMTSQVIDDYQSALVGNFETMKKYGVVLNATVVAQQALQMGLKKTKSELTASDKAMAAHELIVKGSNAAIGDFIRTSDGYANTTKDLDSAWEDFAGTLGSKFLPIATQIKSITAGMLKDFEQMLAGPSLQEQINAVKSEIESLSKVAVESSEESISVQERQTKQLENLKNSWMGALNAQADMSRGSVNLAEISIPDQTKTIDTNAIAIAAAQKRLNDLLEKQKTAASEKEKIRLKAESDAKIKELKRLKEIELKESAALYSAREAAELKYNDFLLSQMDKTSEEYQSAFIDSEMLKWSKVKGITQTELDDINFLIIDSLKEPAKATESFFKGIIENFTEVVQSEMTGIFQDTITGELDSVEDYFRSFTDSLTSMWSSMASSMVMNQSTLGSLTGLQSAGVMGVAGVALGGISSYFSRKDEAEAKAKMREQLREQITDQVEDSIAEIELSSIDFEIYSLNEKFEDLTTAAKKAHLPLGDIIELRKLETEAILEQATAGYDALNDDISDYIEGKQREDWGVTEWSAEFSNLSDEIINLDQNSTTYQEDSQELLTEQIDILKNIYEIQEAQLESLNSTSESLVDQVAGLQTSDGMPISREYYEGQYAELLAAAKDPGDDNSLNTVAIAYFQSFIDDYIDTMSSLGDPENDLIAQASADLLDINDLVQSEMEMLVIALGDNTDAMSGTDGVINALGTLSDTIEGIANREFYEAWAATPPDLTAYDSAAWKDLYSGNGELIGGASSNESLTLRNIIIAGDIQKTQDKIDLITEWANQLDPSMSSDIADWLESVNGAVDGYTAITSLADLDQNNDDLISDDEGYGYRDELDIVLENLEALYNNLPGIPVNGIGSNDTESYETITGFDTPTYYDSNTTAASKSITIDNIVAAVKEGQLIEPMTVNLVVDGKVLASTMIDQSRSNPDYQASIQSMVK